MQYATEMFGREPYYNLLIGVVVVRQVLHIVTASPKQVEFALWDALRRVAMDAKCAVQDVAYRVAV